MMIRGRDVAPIFTPEERAEDRLIKKFLIEKGIGVHLQGAHYIAEIIRCSNNFAFEAIGDHYKRIAERYCGTPSLVERSIRHISYEYMGKKTTNKEAVARLIFEYEEWRENNG